MPGGGGGIKGWGYYSGANSRTFSPLETPPTDPLMHFFDERITALFSYHHPFQGRKGRLPWPPSLQHLLERWVDTDGGLVKTKGCDIFRCNSFWEKVGNKYRLNKRSSMVRANGHTAGAKRKVAYVPLPADDSLVTVVGQSYQIDGHPAFFPREKRMISKTTGRGV